MNEQKKLVPKLRFPEFREFQAWHPCKLSDACEVNPSSPILPDQFVYIDLESVEAGKLIAKKIVKKNEAPCRAQRVLNKGDVIFQMVRPYQRNNFFFQENDNSSYVASTGYAQLRAKDSPEFLFQVVHVDDFVDRVIAKCTGSSYPAINSSDLAEVPLLVPSPNEQQKIADCLSSLDELIAAQARKVEALKTHKKGLMQQLFPIEGETQPRLRFHEFRGAALQSVLLGDVTEEGRSRNGKKHSVASVMGVNKSDGIVPMEARLIAADIARYKLVESDWFAYNPMRLNIGSIARWTGEREILVSPDYVVFKCITNGESSIVPDYLDHFRHTETWYSFVSEGGDGSVRVRIYYKDIAHIGLALPSPSEQQKIADCLTSLHTLVTAATRELDTLKTHKKGLMQKLFPQTSNEATA
jgi:type I restriction enzyme S subunit